MLHGSQYMLQERLMWPSATPILLYMLSTYLAESTAFVRPSRAAFTFQREEKYTYHQYT